MPVGNINNWKEIHEKRREGSTISQELNPWLRTKMTREVMTVKYGWWPLEFSQVFKFSLWISTYARGGPNHWCELNSQSGWCKVDGRAIMRTHSIRATQNCKLMWVHEVGRYCLKSDSRQSPRNSMMGRGIVELRDRNSKWYRASPGTSNKDKDVGMHVMWRWLLRYANSDIA